MYIGLKLGSFLSVLQGQKCVLLESRLFRSMEFGPRLQRYQGFGCRVFYQGPSRALEFTD